MTRDNQVKLFRGGVLSEKEVFYRLQENFVQQYRDFFHDKRAAKAIVVVPSLTLDPEILSKVQGIVHYEERLLCLLLLLRMPRTHVIYITSTPIDPVIIDYYLHLLPGITGDHARQRMHFFSCQDASSLSLSEKILNRPRLLRRIQKAIPHGHLAHLACFNVTGHERKLALRLGLPIYGCDPDLAYWGSKSGSRAIFRECGVDMPPGFEQLKGEQDIVQALAKLYVADPELKKAVIKMNDAFSGEGNAIFSFAFINRDEPVEAQIKAQLPAGLVIIAGGLSYDQYMARFAAMGGIAEAYIDAPKKASPSVQCRINPLGEIDIISTHDQLMSGPDGQVFLGGTFPADPEYAVELGLLGRKVSEAMLNKGVLGRFGVDFVSVKENGIWKHYAIEINLRKGGTTHPYIMLQFLTDGDYNPDTGKFVLPDGNEKCYLFTDNLQHDQFKGLIPEDLMDIAMLNGLHYDATREEGVVFHLIGALSQYGKLGLVCIASSFDRVKYFYDETVKVLRSESFG
ncbi:MAG: carboxylate-amine ligase [Sphingobacteriales bacterium]|nr:carboxylate-amine ligase [Sphingobacteriales bacterium]